jgi:methylthioribose-1-phosphate isomerase
MLDQRLLPAEETYLELRSCESVAEAIAAMVVRGAPAIGISAAYGMVLAARSGMDLDEAAKRLRATRPTAVNLSWAVERMLGAARCESPSDRVAVLAEEAREIHREDVEANRRMGCLAAERIGAAETILTHCNAGALATGGYGTALGVVRAMFEAGRPVRVLADETRPWLQGARLTAWELARDGIPVEIITDGSAAWQMARGGVDAVVVGSDRIASNGDVANKIGTYSVACLAHMHELPFHVAAPWSTVDEACPSGQQIVVEERSAREVTHCGNVRVAAEGVGARNPVFDVTPARLVTAIFTERGIIEPVSAESVRRVGGRARVARLAVGRVQP